MLVIVVILVAAISFSFFTSLHYLIRSYDDNMYRLAETGLKQTIGDPEPEAQWISAAWQEILQQIWMSRKI